MRYYAELAKPASHSGRRKDAGGSSRSGRAAGNSGKISRLAAQGQERGKWLYQNLLHDDLVYGNVLRHGQLAAALPRMQLPARKQGRALPALRRQTAARQIANPRYDGKMLCLKSSNAQGR